MTEIEQEFERENENWAQVRAYTPERLKIARRVLDEVRAGKKVLDAIRLHPLPEGGLVGKHMLVEVYRQLIAHGEMHADQALLAKIRMKPVRTLSGVTVVTVLTKPYPCPGKCIFCPTDVRMPKSYLPDEPGARRALQHAFDPYEQVAARIQALQAVGHPTDKIELLILGGTWSAYRRDYQEWFVRRCLEAMNGAEAPDLPSAQLQNETARARNVGLVIETRPDHVSARELAWLRYLGVTKVQMGAQSLDDGILALNKRGHTAAETRQAVQRLRAAGFKIVLHWMPNLLGATPESDREDFIRLWDGLCPDEIKIYPNQLLANAELYQVWQQGGYTPYETATLTRLIADMKTSVPRYCRINRVIRDIPSTNVVAGNRRTSLRQDAQLELARRGESCRCIRCREVRSRAIIIADLQTHDLVYQADGAEEHFLSFDTPEDRLAGFLRLSLPNVQAFDTGMADLRGAAIIREVHVYGQSLRVGEAAEGVAQHAGLGRMLLRRAERIAAAAGFSRIAVISAIGTRHYYARWGYTKGELYMVKNLKKSS
ncbi:MAG TPA: tRNA uridine(34) 5-carboxymethylaminomethyl modification radical SAM/GNAT enzyme Elp3 [Anaerolineales bacterium]|nr:tRNA uridine(34) 5-carboxymethylaminomethyl modification radical SAM/GNAT enzyme Elp3 [Anaerolineales bacterium]